MFRGVELISLSKDSNRCTREIDINDLDDGVRDRWQSRNDGHTTLIPLVTNSGNDMNFNLGASLQRHASRM